LIAWSIEGALKSGSFDYILVSTVDLEIANIAKRMV
jgi:CMP-N-acetylneuraminic acid synthetase